MLYVVMSFSYKHLKCSLFVLFPIHLSMQYQHLSVAFKYMVEGLSSATKTPKKAELPLGVFTEYGKAFFVHYQVH